MKKESIDREGQNVEMRMENDMDSAVQAMQMSPGAQEQEAYVQPAMTHHMIPPQVPLVCCPVLMNMQCPLIYGQLMMDRNMAAGPYMANQYMMHPYMASQGMYYPGCNF